MSNEESPPPAAIRAAVRDGIVDGVLSLVSIAVWTVLSVLSLVFGGVLVWIGVSESGVASVGLGAVGLFVVVCSCYLLVLLHWGDR